MKTQTWTLIWTSAWSWAHETQHQEHRLYSSSSLPRDNGSRSRSKSKSGPKFRLSGNAADP